MASLVKLASSTASVSISRRISALQVPSIPPSRSWRAHSQGSELRTGTQHSGFHYEYPTSPASIAGTGHQRAFAAAMRRIAPSPSFSPSSSPSPSPSVVTPWELRTRAFRARVVEAPVPTEATVEAEAGASDTSSAASKCPFAAAMQAGASSAEASPALGGGPAANDTRSVIDRNVSNVFDGADPFALVKALLPMQALLGIGALVSAILATFLPPQVPLLLAAAMLLPAAARTLLRALGLISNPDTEAVIRGRITDSLKGEFCVFLLGTRSNGPWKLTKEFGYVGQSFNQMIKELERLPPSAGYLGGDSYVGTNMQRGSHVMAVTYWRSYDHMLRYAHNGSLTHTAAMRQLADRMGSLPDIGLWHEAYIVKPGQHESLYVNCPPFGLGAAGGLVPATGSLKNSKGRVRASALAPAADGSQPLMGES